MKTLTKNYTDLLYVPSFKGRYEYLKLGGTVGHSTFGYDRYINQKFYTSKEWKDVRDHVLLRDNGCDLAMPGHEISGRPIIHHMNPMEPHHIIHGDPWILDPEFLITTTHNTHLAIHYGDKGLLPRDFIQRKAGDTRLW